MPISIPFNTLNKAMIHPMTSLLGKTALVTGSSKGIGKAIAIAFGAAGANIITTGRTDREIEKVTSVIVNSGGTAIGVVADLGIESDINKLAKTAELEFKQVDILVNNAAIIHPRIAIKDFDPDLWRDVLNVNLTGSFLITQKIIPGMIERGHGKIINVSSIAAVCSVGLVAHKASKAAVNALTHSIATGNARYGIRANVIMPGLINTPMAIEGISKARGIAKDDLISERDSRVPLGRKMGTACDVAYAALFLASDESQFITGIELPVDGGQSAQIG